MQHLFIAPNLDSFSFSHHFIREYVHIEQCQEPFDDMEFKCWGAHMTPPLSLPAVEAEAVGTVKVCGALCSSQQHELR